MKYLHLLALLILAIGIGLRFYNLNWGAPYYFHPDERNIASSVSQLKFPYQTNPNFYAYGSLPIYTIYGLSFIQNLFIKPANPEIVTFEQAIITSRIISAILASFLIILIFAIVLKKSDKFVSFIALILSSFSVGLIQYAHFGTFEMWLTFFSIFQFIASLLYLKKGSLNSLIMLGIASGVLIAIKISSLILLLIPAASLIIRYKQCIKSKKLFEITRTIFFIIQDFTLVSFIAVFIFLLTNPYARLENKAFINSITYESQVALGSLPVFYTGSFYETVPIMFQFLNSYPFLINPLVTILLIPSLTILFLNRKKNILYTITLVTFIIHFISQSFLFAKWTRYIVPTLPFVYLLLAFAITEFFQKVKSASQNSLKIIVLLIFLTSSLIFTLSFVYTVYIKKDTRLISAEFAKQTIPRHSLILSEVYDLGIVPFNSTHPNIVLYNFYDLENFPLYNNEQKLLSLINAYDYIVLPSQRIMKSRKTNKNKFPIGNKFYTLLFAEKLGFKKVYQTPCDLFCKITYLGNPVSRLEETTNIFDRPTLYIFKKE